MRLVMTSPGRCERDLQLARYREHRDRGLARVDPDQQHLVGMRKTPPRGCPWAAAFVVADQQQRLRSALARRRERLRLELDGGCWRSASTTLSTSPSANAAVPAAERSTIASAPAMNRNVTERPSAAASGKTVGGGEGPRGGGAGGVVTVLTWTFPGRRNKARAPIPRASHLTYARRALFARVSAEIRPTRRPALRCPRRRLALRAAH